MASWKQWVYTVLQPWPQKHHHHKILVSVGNCKGTISPSLLIMVEAEIFLQPQPISCYCPVFIILCWLAKQFRGTFPWAGSQNMPKTQYRQALLLSEAYNYSPLPGRVAEKLTLVQEATYVNRIQLSISRHFHNLYQLSPPPPKKE